MMMFPCLSRLPVAGREREEEKDGVTAMKRHKMMAIISFIVSIYHLSTIKTIQSLILNNRNQQDLITLIFVFSLVPNFCTI
jgi:hypothetical protein